MVTTEITSCTDSGGKPLDIVGCYGYPTSTCTSAGGAATRAPLRTVGVFAALLLVGTGGSVSAASKSAVVERIDQAPTGSTCRVECVSQTRRENQQEEAGSTEGLSVLQHHLSLNLSDLAAVLRVSRPTIYSWLRDESAPQAQNLSRMRQLFRVTRIWPGISRKPLGSRLRTPVIEGQSVFDLLSEERIDTEVVRKALVSCALLLEQDIARPRPRSTAEIAKQYGLRSQSKHSQEESVAQETGL
jgi:hypothetical protein